MPGRERVPSFQLPSGTTAEQDNSYNLTTVGNIFYNTDTSNVEIRHEDPSNNAAWRDLVVNNREIVDISGNVDIIGNVDISGNLKYSNVRFFAYGTGGVATRSQGSPIQFTATSINDGSHFKTSAYYFEAPIYGVYSLSISLHLEPNTNNNNYNQIAPQRATSQNYNNWDYIYFDTLNSTSGSAHIFNDNGMATANLNFICKLNSGDRIRVAVRPPPYGPTSVTFWMGHCFFCGELISPL